MSRRSHQFSHSDDENIEVEANEAEFPLEQRPVSARADSTSGENQVKQRKHPCCSCWCRLLLLLLIAVVVAVPTYILLEQNKSKSSSNEQGNATSTSQETTTTTAELAMSLQFNDTVDLMSRQEQNAFEQACQAYFSSHWNDTDTQNLQVSVVNQSLVVATSTGSRRDRQLLLIGIDTDTTNEATRRLQGNGTLLMVQTSVSALTTVGSTSSNPSSLAKNVAELVNSGHSSRSALIKNLQQRDDYFSTLTQVSAKPTTTATTTTNNNNQNNQQDEPTVISDDNAPLLCNGRANLCQQRVDQVLFATPHNAYAAIANGFTTLPNQNASLEDAIVAGFRGINLDIGKCDGQLALAHTYCFLGTRDPVEVFTWIDSFLNENPREVLLMPTQIDNDAGGEVTLDDIYQAMQQSGGFLEKLYMHNSSSQTFPTLQELIDSNKRILFFIYNGQSCEELGSSCPPGFHDWFAFAAETQYTFETTQNVEDTSYSCAITRGDASNAFFGVNVFLDFPSETGSSYLNSAEFLQNHLSDCATANNISNVNLIFVDFWQVGNVLEVVENFNSKLGSR